MVEGKLLRKTTFYICKNLKRDKITCGTPVDLRHVYVSYVWEKRWYVAQLNWIALSFSNIFGDIWTRTTHMFAVFVDRRVLEYVLTCTNEVLRTIHDVKSALWRLTFGNLYYTEIICWPIKVFIFLICILSFLVYVLRRKVSLRAGAT